MSMKKLLAGVLALAITFPVVMASLAIDVNADSFVTINSDNFSNENFRNYISKNFDTNKDGKLSITEIANVKTINVSNKAAVISDEIGTPNLDSSKVVEIKSIKGVEFFTNLEVLDVSYNLSLTSMDVTKNVKLKKIVAHNTGLTSIDTSTLTELTRLELWNTKLSSISTLFNPKLVYLDVTWTNIKTLGLTNNPSLKSMVESLVTPKTVNWKGSQYYNFSNSTCVLHYVVGTTIVTSNGAGTAITTDQFGDPIFCNYLCDKFDKNKDGMLSDDEKNEVIQISLVNKGITSIKGLEQFVKLQILYCSLNKLTSLDVSKNTKLTGLYCNYNNLTSLDVSNNTELVRLECTNNSLTSLDVSKNTKLNRLYCYDNSLTSLDVSKNTKLWLLSCGGNNLTSLDVSENTKLEDLNCNDNCLTSLNVSKNTKLKELWCSCNSLTSLDVSKNTNLEYLSCSSNNLTSLDVSKNTNLRFLSCGSNNLTSLDIGENETLCYLYCNDNELSNLDVSGCNLLYRLTCNHNQISTLDLSNNLKLDSLSCYDNPITDLYIANNPSLISSFNAGITYAIFDRVSYVTYRNHLDIDESTTVHTDLAKAPEKPTTSGSTDSTGSGTTSGGTTGGSTGSTGSGTTSGGTTGGSTGSTGSTTSVNIDAKKVDGFAERLYTKCLNRASDPNGKAYWVSQLKAGVSGADVAKQFFYSPEFVGFGLNDQEYVTRLYRTFMDREPDQTGMDFWLSKLAEGKGRDYVFYGFVNSVEWANICLEYGIVSGGTAKPTISRDPSPETIAFATRLYTTCMCRPADAAGVDYWAKELSNMRRSGTQVAYEFFFSKEFIDYGVSDDEYINRLYQTFMGRAADDAGFAYWQGELKNSDRKTILYRFAGCQEFADICSEAGIIR